MLLAGDIGGTKTHLAAFELVGGRLVERVARTYHSSDYPSLTALVATFMREHAPTITAAGFGVAGPVKDGRAVLTNLPWVVDAAELAATLGLPTVALLNDLEANAYGIAALAPEHFAVLSAGAPDAHGNAAVIAAGTGLGEAGLYWDGVQHHVFSSEGGHADFAPRNALEMALLEHLLGRFHRVSYERVLSGPGLLNVYEFLRDTGRGVEPPWLAAELRAGDPAAVISHTALMGRDALCSQALDLFVDVYGAEAGNLALKLLATGGVYVGGGIAPKILPRLQTPAFRRAFTDKGRLTPLLETIPVRVILNDRTALLGAARGALQRSTA